ncbi:nucleotidyltransferase domain-containing protein [soil metagenome]
MDTAGDLSAELEWLVERIRDGYEPEKIILFGSLARGETHEWSDIDLIVVKDTDMSYEERVKALLPVLRGGLVGADIVIYTPEEYESSKQARWGLVRDVERDGKVLYERS